MPLLPPCSPPTMWGDTFCLGLHMTRTTTRGCPYERCKPARAANLSTRPPDRVRGRLCASTGNARFLSTGSRRAELSNDLVKRPCAAETRKTHSKQRTGAEILPLLFVQSQDDKHRGKAQSSKFEAQVRDFPPIVPPRRKLKGLSSKLKSDSLL